MKLHNFFIALLLIPFYLFANSGDVCELSQVQNLGSLKAATFVVDDIDSVIAQWTAATGTEFSPVTTTEQIVFFLSGGPKRVTLKSAYSVRGEPFLEIVESDTPLGPWAPQVGPGGATSHLVFSAHSVHQVDQLLSNANFTKIAFCGNDFAFFKGENGLLVKVINENLLPSAETNSPAAPIDFGTIRHIDLAVSKFEELKTQINLLNGSTWTNFAFQGAPFLFLDGVHVIDVFFAITDILPELQLEHVVPPLGVFQCSDTTYNMHPAYVIPAGGMEDANTQMINQGFVLTTSLSLPGIGLVIGCYEGNGQVSIELIDERFNF